MKWIALNDRVIVQADGLETQHEGRVILERTAAAEVLTARTGVVVSVGPKANENNAGLLHEGCRVIFNKYTGLVVDAAFTGNAERDPVLLAIPASELLAIDAESGTLVRDVVAIGEAIVLRENNT